MVEDEVVIRVIAAADDFADWFGLHALLQTSFAFMAGRIDPPSSLNRIDAEDLARKAAGETLIIASDDATQLVGCAFAQARAQTMPIGKLAVGAEHRGDGIARRIIEVVEELGRSLNCESLELETRIELTENYQSFAALGFSKIGESSHPGFQRPTSIRTRKLLGPRSTSRRQLWERVGGVSVAEIVAGNSWQCRHP
jgi:predicted GNAT family N-acyltransferase